MDVSIIIVNYNSSLLIQECISSIKRYTSGLEYEIIIVDNGSPEDTNIVNVASQDNIKFIQSYKNLGFGKANNVGLTYARGKYVLFLNPDTYITENVIGMMVEFAESYKGQLGALGAILTNRKGEYVHSYGKFPRMSDDWHKLVVNPIKKFLQIYTPSKDTYPLDYMCVDYVTGADLMVRRKVLDACGLFNPLFFLYFEETELQYRFKKRGYVNVVMNAPYIVHLEGECSDKSSSSKFLRDTIRQQKSEYLYFKLTEPRWKYFLYRVIHPILRQSVWFNPNVSLRDKISYIKSLFTTEA